LRFQHLAPLVFAFLLPWLSGCRRNTDGAAGQGVAPIRFVDVAPQAGIHFHHTNGQNGRAYTAETLGSGCALLDYDGDGRLDLFLVNSSRLPGFGAKGSFYPALYRNEGGGKFRDVTRQAGLAIDAYGMGVAVADYDNDGDPDLLLTAYRGSHLFRNDRGRFTEVTGQAGIRRPEWATSAAWLDYDRDGFLDLFICSYLNWTPASNKVCGHPGHRFGCDPTYYSGTESVLYHNNKDGTFSDVTKQAGVGTPNGKALGVAVWDFDDDGWPDFAVANDTEPNWLFHNNRNGTFTQTGVEAGIAYGLQGRQRAGMGIDTADYDHSGREAVLIGNLSGEGLALFRPEEGPGNFADGAEAAGLYQPSLPYTTFGARFLDYDLDGFPDIVTANGHVREDIAHSGLFSYAQRLQVFHNVPGEGSARRFQDVTAGTGPGVNTLRVARGLAVGDFDGDGDPDLLVNSNSGAVALLENQGRPHGRWLGVKLAGQRSNRDGIGSQVFVAAAGVTQRGWVRSGGSFGSEDERVARFGLGTAETASVEVHWPSGVRDRIAQVSTNQVVVVHEGQAKTP
jgi:hypothetical protein